MRILCIRPKESAVWNYRMTRPLKNYAVFRKSLLRKNEKVRIGELAERLKRIAPVWNIKYLKDPHTADVLVSMRNLAKAKLVMDIDDNIWQVPIGNIVRQKDGWDTFVAVNTSLVECADWVTVATEPLKQALLPLNKNIVVLPNLIDPSEWNHNRKKHDKIRIAWVWSPTHFPDIPIVADALERIYNEYKDQIEIVIFGRENNMFKFPTTNIKGVRFSEFPKLFTEEGIDISICPLADNDFNKCKSNIKWLESTMAGACVVASNVYPYEHSIRNGKTGLLAKTPGDWIKHLSNLIERPELRKELHKNALEEVLGKYDINKDTQWQLFYKTLC